MSELALSRHAQQATSGFKVNMSELALSRHAQQAGAHQPTEAPKDGWNKDAQVSKVVGVRLYVLLL